MSFMGLILPVLIYRGQNCGYGNKKPFQKPQTSGKGILKRIPDNTNDFSGQVRGSKWDSKGGTDETV
jgi:hypothetical protein